MPGPDLEPSLPRPRVSAVTGTAKLEFGWFLPTSGDTTCYGDHSKFIRPSAELFDRVVLAAEAASFEHFLVRVAATCWEAWISSAMAVAKTHRIKALVAARLRHSSAAVQDGHLRPTGSEPDRRAERARRSQGHHSGQGRLICADGRGRRHYEGAVGGARPEDFDGHFHTTLKGARIPPRLLQQPHPRSTSGAAQPKPGKAKHS